MMYFTTWCKEHGGCGHLHLTPDTAQGCANKWNDKHLFDREVRGFLRKQDAIYFPPGKGPGLRFAGAVK